MSKEYIATCQIIEAGTDLVSANLRWLLRNALLEHCNSKAISTVVYNKESPENALGDSYIPTRSIAINLGQHLDVAIERVTSSEINMFTSIRTFLIYELINTIIHEGFHHSKALEKGDPDYTINDEDSEAHTFALEKAWEIAKKFDVDIIDMGPYLNELITDFFRTITEETKEKPEMWKDLQIFMWENSLGYYNPDKESEAGLREVFESMASPDAPWTDEPIKFNVDIIEQEQKEPPQKQEPLSQSVNQGYNIPENNPTMNNPSQIGQQLNQPMQQYPQQQAQQQVQQPIQQDSPDPYENMEPEMANIVRITENVTRTLFHHIVTKCEFNQDGGFNYPTAVMEPVNIEHIPGAAELFTHADIVDEMGITQKTVPCQGWIKGSVTPKTNLPRYIMYMNVFGQLHKRVFIAANPNKVADNQELTKWAREAKEGYIRMMLLEDGKGIRANLELAPGQKLGQEALKLWD